MLSTRPTSYKQVAVNSFDFPRLADVSIICIEGPDAEAFAQSQFMGDVAALEPGQWHWSGWLSAKGRVQALFALLRRGPGDLVLLLLDHPPETFCEGLQRFIFRSKVRLRVADELAAFAEWGSAPNPEASDRCVVVNDGCVGLDMSTPKVSRRCWLAPHADRPADAAATQQWRDADLRHGLPRWSPGREHSWTPHMLSLDRLKAFSVRKGCYPGQEIVARTHFLGQSRRQTWWLQGEGLNAGLAVTDETGRALGEVIEATGDGRGALAVAAIGIGQEVKCGHSAVLALAPEPGLARPT